MLIKTKTRQEEEWKRKESNRVINNRFFAYRDDRMSTLNQFKRMRGLEKESNNDDYFSCFPFSIYFNFVNSIPEIIIIKHANVEPCKFASLSFYNHFSRIYF